MPSRLDPLLLMTDCIELSTEQPYLDPNLIVGLYQHLASVHERQPTLEEARDYISRITAVLPEETIRAHLQIDGPAEVASDREVPTVDVPPRRGRPKGSRSATCEEIVAAFRAFQATHGRRPTQAQLAMNLRPAIAARTLQQLLAAYRLPWPIE